MTYDSKVPIYMHFTWNAYKRYSAQHINCFYLGCICGISLKNAKFVSLLCSQTRCWSHRQSAGPSVCK